MTNQTASEDRVRNRILDLIASADCVLATHKPNPSNVIGFSTLSTGEFAKWRERSLSLLRKVAGDENQYTTGFTARVKDPFQSQVNAGRGILESFLVDYDDGDFALQSVPTESPIGQLRLIADRFHEIVRQLRHRHSDRPTLDVNDEYDVQDLMHALLRLYFSDIRPEEYSPSYAGGNSRIDFLVKHEQLVVEIKHARQSMSAKDLGSQLIDDIARYQVHPDCKALVCFVYDPEGRLPNPRGLESDLSSSDKEVPVIVLIHP